jgi:adenylate cyclase
VADNGRVRDRVWQALFAAPPADTGDLIERLWSAVVEEGVGLRRATVALRTLHPEIVGLGFVWERGQPMQRNQHPHGELSLDRFRQSPLRAVFAGEGPIRVRLDPGAALPFPVLEDLRARGMTDYLALPLKLTSGQVHALTLACDRPGGFSDDEVRLFEELAAPLATCIEARETRRVARTLLDTYVGTHGGNQVLDGHIQRGDVELIDAVVLSCDLRGFTPLSIELPPREVVALLNEYFDRVCAPIHYAGGEVVKFIGDGILAAFAIHDGAVRPACETALAAARAGLAALHGQPVGARAIPLRMGVALHFGQVAFGNVGSRTRLDFTVIGQAVNLASRLAGLCARLERELLVSAQFAAQLPDGARSLGVHQVRGLPHPVEVFTY